MSDTHLPGSLSAPDIPTETVAPVTFHEKAKEAFEGLLYLGRLEKTFTWAGHTFVIRTLTTSEELEVGELIRPYVGTTSETRAFWAARVAASLVSVDGKPLPVPMDESETPLKAKFAWAQQCYPWTIDAITAHVLDLGQMIEEALNEMGKTSGDQTPTSGTASL